MRVLENIVLPNAFADLLVKPMKSLVLASDELENSEELS